MIDLHFLDKAGVDWAQNTIAERHYLRKKVDPRCSVEGYKITANGETAGIFLFGRPEATRCQDWYGGVDDVRSGRCQVTRWQIINLARIWIDPLYQMNGERYGPEHLPGFEDRHGVFRSTLISTAVQIAVQRIGFDYLVRRPPVFLDEPYDLVWLMSYCDLKTHRGAIYPASGFELYRTNDNGIQTWRQPLPALTEEQSRQIIQASMHSERAKKYRMQRSQLALPLSTELCS